MTIFTETAQQHGRACGLSSLLWNPLFQSVVTGATWAVSWTVVVIKSGGFHMRELWTPNPQKMANSFLGGIRREARADRSPQGQARWRSRAGETTLDFVINWSIGALSKPTSFLHTFYSYHWVISCHSHASSCHVLAFTVLCILNFLGVPDRSLGKM